MLRVLTVSSWLGRANGPYHKQTKTIYTRTLCAREVVTGCIEAYLDLSA